MIWRTGRKVGRTIYLQRSDDGPSDEDDLVGLLDNEYLAGLACDSVNEITTLLGFLNHELEVGVPRGESADTVVIDLLRRHYDPAVYAHRGWPWWLCPRCTEARRRLRR